MSEPVSLPPKRYTVAQVDQLLGHHPLKVLSRGFQLLYFVLFGLYSNKAMANRP